MDPAEQDRRRPVWIALSDLWLDTEITEPMLRHIAGVLQASGYDRATLRAIYLYEVAPVVYRNLLSVAGVWDGFEEAWLCAEAERWAQRWPTSWIVWRWLRLKKPLMTYATEAHWLALMNLLDMEQGGSSTAAASPQ